MSTKKDQPEEATPLAETTNKAASAPPVDPWVQVVRIWADKANAVQLADALRVELALQGITTVEQLANAPMGRIVIAARAAMRADAQALQAAAAKILEDKL